MSHSALQRAEEADDVKLGRALEQPPARVGRYELLQRLGHGGMATVYLGRATGTAGFERLVAIKTIHPHLADQPEFVEMFLDEARIAARIHHPNVVEIIDLGEFEGVFYMVMEYVEGDSLAALLRELKRTGTKLPVAATLQIVADACAGLTAAHALTDHDGNPLGLVHRDISPQNLLVTMDGRVKVVDFGIMKAAGRPRNTLTGQLRGKLPYMSPEQAQGMPLDARTDVFAIGSVMWELCTNERLFAGATESEVLDKVTRCRIPDVHQACADVPPALREIMQRALQAERSERYADVAELLADIRPLLRKYAEDEPRERLAELMDRHLAQRVQYLRARVRALAGSGQSSASQSMPLLGPGDEVATVVVAAHDEVGVQPVRTPTGTQAITREVTTRLRRFAPWVLLPMLGAAFAVFMLSRPDETRTTAAASAQPQTIKWYLSTEPPGALVSIDGARQPEATPTTIELPRSEQPVRVRVEKPGFEPAEQVLAPLHSDNFPIFLTPVRQPPTPAADLPIASPVVAAPVAQRDDGRALSMKTRKRQAKPVAEKSSDAAPQKPRSSTDHDLEPPPDFAKYRRRHAGSAP